MDSQTLDLPPRSQLIAASCIAALCAFPPVTLMSSMVIFPLLLVGGLAIFVNVGPIVLLVAAGLDHAGFNVELRAFWHRWLLAGIVWTGCAFGFAHWGDFGSAIGATNLPFLKVFFSPILLALGYQIN